MRPDDDWRSWAKCLGGDPDEYDTSAIPRSDRDWVAEVLCSGCPVMKECGMDALAHREVGVVRSGVALDPIVGDDLYEQYNYLRRRLGWKEVPREMEQEKGLRWPRVCSGCRAIMRPAGEPKEDWPGTVVAFNRHVCGACKKKERKQ